MDLTVTPTPLDGVVLIQPHIFPDERGFFLETWNARDFVAAGLPETFVQDSHSRSTRGVHPRLALPGRDRAARQDSYAAPWAVSSTLRSICGWDRRPSASGLVPS